MTEKRRNSSGAFVKLPLELLASAAWRNLGINARRFLDFLMEEHLRAAGRKNGFLLAPRRQIENFGIGARYVSGAIEEAERAGLVDVRRGVGRRPNTYALTWLPLADGTEPSNRWREMTSQGKPLQMTSQGKHLMLPKGSHKARSDFPREVTKAQNKGIRREAPSIDNLPGRSRTKGDGAADVGEAARVAWPGGGQ